MNDLKEDKKFFKEGGDIGFSPERNEAIINQTIKIYEANRAKRMKTFADKLEETTDATAHFLKALDSGKLSTGSIEDKAIKYFGKKELARLRGEKILSILKPNN